MLHSGQRFLSNIRLLRKNTLLTGRNIHTQSLRLLTLNARSISISSFESSFVQKKNDFNRCSRRIRAYHTSSEESVGSSLIPMVNKLQEVCSLVGEQVIDLPQIVVIGGQSSGKSSVLENLVGRDFLPRGSDLVTRRPLILQLNRLEAKEEEWGEFLHKPGVKFSFDQIRKEIEVETERLTGKNKGISPEPILLKIYSPNVLPLTLVDTPGMTRVPVGDQPPDIEIRIRDMIHKFISQPNAIILAVQPATADLATSDALKLAREVDPEGNRTVGVITKLDIMDKGTNALDTLLGRTIPLKLGFVGVVSRSQHDINVGKPIKQMLKDESKFFQEHPIYNSVTEITGTGNLAIRCNKLLANHIYKVLPSLKNQIRSKIKEKQEELQAYGTPLSEDKSNQGWLLLHLLNKFSEDFKSAIDGVPEEVNTRQLNGGARIRYIFQDTFAKHMEKVSVDEGLTTNDIKTAIRNAAGARASLFVPEKAFDLLIKRQIELLREPCLRVADMVFDELLRIMAQLDTKELHRFKVLKHRIVEVANTTLRNCLKPTNKMIKTLVAMELSYINTNHPDFLGGNMLKTSVAEQVEKEVIVEERKPEPLYSSSSSNRESGQRSGFFSSLFGGSSSKDTHPSSSSPSSTGRQTAHSPSSSRSTTKGFDFNEPPSVITVNESLSETDRMQIKLIKQLIRSYFKIAKGNLQDNVTKVVMYFLVEGVKENLHKDLMSELYKEEAFPELLHEDPQVAIKRKLCAEQLEALKQAKSIIRVAEVENLSSR